MRLKARLETEVEKERVWENNPTSPYRWRKEARKLGVEYRSSYFCALWIFGGFVEVGLPSP
jgi:hypothetical protein